MPVHAVIHEMPSLARLDSGSIPDRVWCAPLLPPGRYLGYQDAAILADVPAGQWLGKAAVEPLFADDTTPASSVIELVPRIPSGLRAAMDSYPRDAIGQDGRGQPTAELRAAAAELGGTVLHVSLAPSGEANTTVIPLESDYEHRGLRAGFHLDDRDGQPLAQRVESRRRFIPSKGPGVRLAAVCLPDIVTVGRILGVPEDEVPGCDIFREYLRQFPDGAVCVGIPVQPGQGSLVNTDLVVHDGMTIGATETSMTFQILGNWVRGELASLP
jgi:hypothetical protein